MADEVYVYDEAAEVSAFLALMHQLDIGSMERDIHEKRVKLHKEERRIKIAEMRIRRAEDILNQVEQWRKQTELLRTEAEKEREEAEIRQKHAEDAYESINYRIKKAEYIAACMNRGYTRSKAREIVRKKYPDEDMTKNRSKKHAEAAKQLFDLMYRANEETREQALQEERKKRREAGIDIYENEVLRMNAEIKRMDAEDKRKEAEILRVKAEEKRKEATIKREKANKRRDKLMEQLEQDDYELAQKRAIFSHG